MAIKSFFKDRIELLALLTVIIGGCYHLDSKIDGLSKEVYDLGREVSELKGKVDIIADKLQLSVDTASVDDSK